MKLTKAQETQAKKILDVLLSARFATAYSDSGQIGSYIVGGHPVLSIDELEQAAIAEVVKLFNL